MSQEFSQYNVIRKQIERINRLISSRLPDAFDTRDYEYGPNIQHLSQLATLGQLTSSLSHEIVTPLSTVKINLEVLDAERDGTPEVRTAIMGIEQIDLLVKLFLRQSKLNYEKIEFSTNEEITNALKLLEYKIKKSQTRIFLDLEDAQLYGNPVKFSQVITNLVSNAIDAYDNIESISKYIYLRSMAGIKDYYLYVKDFGTGISEETNKNLFKCFYTTKPAFKGTGLGLSISKAIIEEDFLGKIDCIGRKEPTVFRIKIPIDLQVDN